MPFLTPKKRTVMQKEFDWTGTIATNAKESNFKKVFSLDNDKLVV